MIGQLLALSDAGFYAPTLVSYMLYQHHHCQVTQPLLLEQLCECDNEIYTGIINDILMARKKPFKEQLQARFDVIFNQRTPIETLNHTLKRIYRNKGLI